MRAAEKKKLLAKETNSLSIEFTVDDELVELVLENTHARNARETTSVLRCITLVAGGTSFATSCKLTGITTCRLNGWRSKEWYARACELIKQRLDDQLDGKFTHAINKSTQKLHQRLDIGDPVVNTKTGDITYKPVSAKDAAIITSIFFDKRNLLRNKPTSISSSQSTDERLTMLAGKFRDISDTAYTVQDADYTTEVSSTQLDVISEQSEVIHEQRQQTQTTISAPSTSGVQLEHDIQCSESKESKPTSKWEFTDACGQD